MRNGTDAIAALEQAWQADGWRTRVIELGENENTVLGVKARINATVADAPFLTHLMLLGQVAYPYSGNQVPDGHTNNHLGAWFDYYFLMFLF